MFHNIILCYSKIINRIDTPLLSLIQDFIILWYKTSITICNQSRISDSYQCHSLIEISGNIIYSYISRGLLKGELIEYDTQYQYINSFISDRNNIIRAKGYEIFSRLLLTEYSDKIFELPAYSNIIEKTINRILLYRECIIVKASCFNILSLYINKLQNDNNREKIKKFEILINNTMFYKNLNDIILYNNLKSPILYYSIINFFYNVLIFQPDNILYIYQLQIWKDIFKILSNYMYTDLWEEGNKQYLALDIKPPSIFDIFDLQKTSITSDRILHYKLTTGYSYLILTKYYNYTQKYYNISVMNSQILLLKLYIAMVNIKPELVKVYFVQNYNIIPHLYSILNNKIVVNYSIQNNPFSIELIKLTLNTLAFVIQSITDTDVICNKNILSIFLYYINENQPLEIQYALCNFIYTIYSLFNENIQLDGSENKCEVLCVKLYQLYILIILDGIIH